MNRRGLALGLVLWALVIGSAVLTVAALIGMQERRAAGSGRRAQRALARAETGLADALVGWTPGLLGQRLPRTFDSLVLGSIPASSAPSWQGAIRRLGRGLFFVTVQAGDPVAPGATIATVRRLGWTVRVRPVVVTPSAALQAGSVSLAADAQISGLDQSTVVWEDCLGPDSVIAGVAAGEVTQQGSALITGAPPVTFTPGDSGFPASQLSALDQLSSQATVVLPGGTWTTGPTVSGRDCDVWDSRNWGDPSSADATCGGYWPIVRVVGDARLLGGSGQGILLVDGDLAIDGPYRFSGIVMVRGRFMTSGAGGLVRVDGALFAARAGSMAQPVSGTAVTFSKCMIYNALQSSGTLIPLRSRAWKQLF